MNLCSKCDTDFSSVGAFDQHHVNDDGSPVVCDVGVKYGSDSKHAGKPKLMLAGKRDGRPLYKFNDLGQFDGMRSGPQDEQRDCKRCGQAMRKAKQGRGRWPSYCSTCGGTGVLIG